MKMGCHADKANGAVIFCVRSILKIQDGTLAKVNFNHLAGRRRSQQTDFTAKLGD